jgi:hypothetical protein
VYTVFLSVRLGHTLKFVLLLDGVTVGASLSGVDELIGETLGDGLYVPERRLTGSGAQKPDSLVDTTKRRHVNSLTTDGTSTTNPGRVLAGSGVNDGVNQHLQRVLKKSNLSVNKMDVKLTKIATFIRFVSVASWTSHGFRDLGGCEKSSFLEASGKRPDSTHKNATL